MGGSRHLLERRKHESHFVLGFVFGTTWMLSMLGILLWLGQ
jgi:hypothetical protein